MKWDSPHDIVANLLDFGFEVSEFELQLRYYVHFRFGLVWFGFFV